METDNESPARVAMALAIGLGMAVAGASARAQGIDGESGLRAIEHRLEEGARRLQELRRQLDDAQRRLDEDRRELERMAGRSEAYLGGLSARGGPPQLAQAPTGPVGEAPKPPDQPAASARIFDEPTALTPRGKLVLEPTYQFVHATDNRIALVGYSVIPAITIGLIDVRRVSRDIHTLSVTARYGVTGRFELEGKLPWVSASSSTLTRPLATPSVTDSFFDSNGSGMGDIELAARYQLNQFRGDNAVYIGYLRYKSRTGEGPFEVPIDPATGLQQELPTGSGFHGLQAGVTFLYPSDPAVFFGGIAYMHNFSRDVGNGFGRIRPGGVTDINLGMGLALNERSSFSIGYQHSIVGRTSQSDPASAARLLAPSGSLQLGTLRFGIAYRVTQKQNVNLSLGIGVTDDSPDVELTLRVPWSL
ncbi:acetate kinase [Zeimonas arvi]|uniref:Acetate kinase n=1 Tax=Zeimonas arvi TaxID=2498847 RepID=A0A5C8NVR4_9BURK|nr:acetate kinase [Zeimonas arvi]TXL65256.1 acetate kinase [Zeimonas arvi]